MSQDHDEDVTILDEVTAENGQVNLEGHAGIISGDVHPGSVIRGERDLTIEGQVRGEPQTPCVIEIGGNLHIEQFATRAKVMARNIVIMGDVEECQLQADKYIEVHGNVAGGLASLGSRFCDIKVLNAIRTAQRTANERKRELEVYVNPAARRFIRDYPQVNLEVGAVLKMKGRRLEVDMKPLYALLNTQVDEEQDKALQVFYRRVVVSTLTQNNQHYLSQNPLRPKIFLKLLEDLNEYVMNIWELEKLNKHIQDLRTQANALLKDLRNPAAEPGFRVGGTVGEGVMMHFVRLQGFKETPKGVVDIKRETTLARVVGQQGGMALEVTSPIHEKWVQQAAGDQFINGLFTAKKETVVWQTF